MKIESIIATPVNIPLEAPFFWSVGIYPGTSKTVIQLRTDQGLMGLGEAPSWDCAPLINNHLAPLLVGKDALDINGCELACLPEWRVVQNTDDASVVKAFGGIEMALWDIRGKAWGQPLYKLLGGAVRKDIPFTEYFAFRQEEAGKGGETTAEQVTDYCQQMAEEHGSTMFEGKLTPGRCGAGNRDGEAFAQAPGSKGHAKAGFQHGLVPAHGQVHPARDRAL